MKIAISSANKDIKGSVAEVFGRCPYFIIAEIEKGEVKKTGTIENKNTEQMSGAGILVARLMAEENVNAVITKNVGPRAFDVLRQFKIEIYQGSGKTQEVLQKFIDGKLKKIQ